MKKFLGLLLFLITLLVLWKVSANLQFPATRHYLASLSNQLWFPGLPRPVLAAPGIGGYGFNALEPLRDIWTISRNLAYVIFALLFVVTGLMIAFRVKIDPKTAASLQNSLPRMVGALIVVTFSYAIAGFLIDLTWVLAQLINSLLGPVLTAGFIGSTFTVPVINMNITIPGFDITNFGLALGAPALIIMGSATNALGNLIGNFLVPTGLIPGMPDIPWWLKSFVPGLGTTVGLATIIAGIIVFIAILWAMLKTFFMLIGAFINVILAVIFAPLFLMLDALPGRNMFSSWLRNLIVNLLTFLFVIVLAMIGAAVGLGSVNFGFGSGGLALPLLGGMGKDLQALLGMGIFMAIPNALNILQETFKNPPAKYGSAWGQAVGFGANPWGLRSAGVGLGKIAVGNQLVTDTNFSGPFWSGPKGMAIRQAISGFLGGKKY